MTNPLSNPVIGGMVGTLGALIIAGAGYYAYTSTAFNHLGSLSRMRGTCLASVAQSADVASTLRGLSATAFCGCIIDRIYPALSTPSREYVKDLYARIEKDAPTSATARNAYDADFVERLKAVFQTDQMSNIGSTVQFIAELNQINGMDMGPECNRLK